jgi:hypothetical protein
MSNIDGPSVLTQVAWKDGTALPFDLQQNATLAFPSGGTVQNKVAVTGRIEVIKAPAAPATGAPSPTGTIRLRAEVDGNNHVEGQVDVEVCAAF